MSSSGGAAAKELLLLVVSWIYLHAHVYIYMDIFITQGVKMESEMETLQKYSG